MDRRSRQREDIEILKRGVKDWNAWRQENPHLAPYLREADLSHLDLRGVDLSNAEMSRAVLAGSDLLDADLYQAELYRANLTRARLKGCDMRGAKLHLSDLTEAYLSFADLYRADFIGTCLDRTDFKNSRCDTTTFSQVDLSRCLNLEHSIHSGPSNFDISTLRLTSKNLPVDFLKAAGVPQIVIDYAPSLLADLSPVQYYSCFISYSHHDETFARRLFERLREAQLQVWFAPESVKRGRKLHEQIDEAIHLHDKLLLVLSRSSLTSNWVLTEVRKALKRQEKEGRKMLFPVRLIDFEDLKQWECFDADSGSDIATLIREYFIPDFSKWQDLRLFEKSVAELIRDLRAS